MDETNTEESRWQQSQQQEVAIILTAVVGGNPIGVTLWKFPSGNVAQIIQHKEKFAALPEDVRKALEAAYELFEKLRGHRGEIVE